MKIFASAILFLLFTAPAFADEAASPQVVTYEQCSPAAQADDELPGIIEAGRGCCSRHGGMSGQCSNGHVVCRDGSISPTCTCRADSNVDVNKG